MVESITKAKVLVSGVTGFLASHVLKLLLEQNYQVVGTIRSIKNEEKNKVLYDIVPEKKNNLTLVEANLNDEQCWDKIMPGIDYVMHIASPFPSEIPQNENEIIKPAVNGATFVFKAALKHNVKKIIITSSVAAIFSGWDLSKAKVFTEKDWSIVQNSAAYEKSKHLAEKAVWDLWNEGDNKNKIQLTFINPSGILGPNLIGSDSTSQLIVKKIMNNDLPGSMLPKLQFGLVDVRDVALAHIRAMERAAETNGKRYILSNASMWMVDIKKILQQEFAQYDYSFPKFEVGKFMVSLASLFDKQARLIKHSVGYECKFDNSLSKNELGIEYIDMKKCIIDTAYNLIDLKQIKMTKKMQAQLEKK